ncbi:MAG: hypothetical protein AB2A00_06160 [Myxococcota bacterium]
MAASLPTPPRWRDLWPFTLLIVLTALFPPVGGGLVLAGLLGLWATRAPGTWPWEGRFWDAMQWTVTGALAIVTLGVLLNQGVVVPVWRALRGGG